MRRPKIFITLILCFFVLTGGCATYLVQPEKPITSITLEQIRQSAETEEKEMVAFLSQTIKYESVEDFGYELNPETKKLMAFTLDRAKGMGFSTRTAANGMVGIIEYGQGKESVGVLIHLDVVPASKEDTASWTHPPFEGKVADGHVWGRGAQDDKGALASTLWAAKVLTDHNVTFKRQLRIVLGTKEEKSFESMTRFIDKETQPDFGFVPDGMFITQAEKGIADLDFTFTGLSGSEPSADRDEIVHWSGGTVINSVPAFSYIVIKSRDVDAARSELLDLTGRITRELKSGKSWHFFGVHGPHEANLKVKDYSAFIKEYSYDHVPKGDLVLYSEGKEVHASTPWLGKNAIVEVALVGSRMQNIADTAYRRAFRFVAQKIGLSFDGSGLTDEKGAGIPFVNPTDMPPAPPYITTPLKYYGTSANLGLVDVRAESDQLVLSIDFRTGLRNTNAQLLRHSRSSARQYQGQVDYQPGLGSHYEAFYCSNDHPLLNLVVDSYRTVRPERPAYPKFLPLQITSPATTYLKLLKNFVNFGPVDIYPDLTANYFHQKNERVSIKSLKDNMILYAYTLQRMLQMETAPVR